LASESIGIRLGSLGVQPVTLLVIWREIHP